MFSNSWCPQIINAHQSPQYLEKNIIHLCKWQPFLIIPNNFENILKIYIFKNLLIRQILKHRYAISIKWFKINWTPKKNHFPNFLYLHNTRCEYLPVFLIPICYFNTLYIYRLQASFENKTNSWEKNCIFISPLILGHAMPHLLDF